MYVLHRIDSVTTELLVVTMNDRMNDMLFFKYTEGKKEEWVVLLSLIE